jgi:hypothetical protein
VMRSTVLVKARNSFNFEKPSNSQSLGRKG